MQIMENGQCLEILVRHHHIHTHPHCLDLESYHDRYVMDLVHQVFYYSYYIDPETKIYGALGHEIIENNSKNLVEIKTGNIFRNSISSITKSFDAFSTGKI